MILSVSRRTDIPAFYSTWFFNRIKEGFVYVRNPMNIHQISKIILTPQLIDCIVFWSKNPKPMLSRLKELDAYNYYFQFTINPYDTLLEKYVPKKHDVIDTFKALSDTIGPNRVIWRYDPILFTNTINIDYHKEYFARLIERLHKYTNHCTLSFIDNYKKTERNLKNTSARDLTEQEVLNISQFIAKTASEYNIEVQTCAEKYDLHQFGIIAGKCIDDILISEIAGQTIRVKKDKYQRSECGCITSIDIGEYNTCCHNCLYCYANFNQGKVATQHKLHDPNSPLLIGHVGDDDIIKERKIESFRNLF